jgi:1-deoxy-D-xylulose-5-phosphate synthase
MRFIKPLDTGLLQDVWQRHRVVITAEENALAGGFGAGVLEWAQQEGPADGPLVERLGIPDRFQDQATRAELLADMGLDADGIAAAVTAALERCEARRDERSAS